ncbi:uncharacterized protein METZ01_LOCUS339977 [marine metagenome]|jgi:hypothetical protein|uniref:Uncharacterized protein n=1 Tax=marine metagenome TaxID=408172 RepID=A0A382QNP0_9ZZZZ
MYNFKNIIILTVGLLFTVFAGLQINDPDPFIWITAYSFPALLSFLFLMGYSNRYFQWILPAYLFFAFYLFLHNKDTEVMHIFDETTNEMLGLILCAAWMFILPRFKNHK